MKTEYKEKLEDIIKEIEATIKYVINKYASEQVSDYLHDDSSIEKLKEFEQELGIYDIGLEYLLEHTVTVTINREILIKEIEIALGERK